MAFAFALLEARRHVDECPPLSDARAQEQHETLRGLLANLAASDSVWRRSE
jgi:CO dehydrogenase/acetyl-CoA synthase gamma subunit (corrinoid Fe-S protein)